MFMTTQPWQNDGDYRKLIQNLEPPPPPGNDNAWELHFCKWWGWNWVRKKEVVEEEVPTQKPGALKSVEENKLEKKSEKKPEKKPVKHLCQSLCFRKKKNQKPLQDKYNTPSNSAIENDNENKRKSIANSAIENDNENKRKSIANSLTETEDKKIEERIKQKRRRSKEWTSSTDKCCCCCRCQDRDRDRSSTEESVECINITCCSCCNSRDRPPTNKNTIEKYTQDFPPQCTMRATQTEQTQKKSRRKRICVVCCCRCNQNNQPLCCTRSSSGNIRDVEEKIEKQTATHLNHERAYTHKSVEAQPDFDKSQTTLHRKECKNCCFPVYRTSADQPYFEKPIKKPTPKHPGHLKQKFEPLYMTGMPIDTMLYHNKSITKFGIPSRSYSWIHATKSDILDQFPHSRINHEPLNVSPTKLQDLESEPSALFSPLSVDKEIETLKQIENDVKMDLKSRIMLDAICDAILSKDKEPEISSSIFLNEFTYPSNVTPTECIIKDIYKSEQNNTCSKLNQTGLEGIIFEDVTNNTPYKNKVSCETNTSSLHLSVGNQEDNSIRDYLNVRSPQIYAMDNMQRRSLHNPYVPLNYSTHHEHLIPNENKCPQLIDYTIANNYPLIPKQRPQTFTRNRLVPTIKRAASPSPRGRDIKKVKLGEPSALPSFNSSHVSDIFKKVDEIILRSKVNNEEIQTVLNTIPKSTYKFFTSWEVSNLLQNLNQAENTNSSIASTSEGKKEKIEKVKAPQVKKKKVCSRPSLIPKRVTDSKLNKKNTG